MRKPKFFRAFLEGPQHSDSYIRTEIDGYATLKMSDCDRRILWYFGVPGDARAKKKIAKVKGVVDALYDHIHSK